MFSFFSRLYFSLKSFVPLSFFWVSIFFPGSLSPSVLLLRVCLNGKIGQFNFPGFQPPLEVAPTLRPSLFSFPASTALMSFPVLFLATFLGFGSTLVRVEDEMELPPFFFSHSERALLFPVFFLPGIDSGCRRSFFSSAPLE